LKPYIVKSRQSDALLANLLKDDYPILFEGLHTCCYIDAPELNDRKKIYRESNIEHHYYYHLFKAEKKLFRKFYHLSESLKLRFYQRKLIHAGLMLTISRTDTDYLKKHFPNNRVEYLPSFHPNERFSVIPGKGDYALYHGKLSVTENYNAAEYLIEKVFAGMDKKLIIAGMDAPQHLIRLINKHANIELVENPGDEKMFELIRNAQINVLVTFQATGLKLKLLNTLYQGRYCLVNCDMVQGTGLESLCEIADDSAGLRQKVEKLFGKTFDLSEVENREKLLQKNYSNEMNAKKLIGLLF
jgi:predicted nucleic acid-binding protein